MRLKTLSLVKPFRVGEIDPDGTLWAGISIGGEAGQ
jgi:hypothetical protein